MFVKSNERYQRNHTVHMATITFTVGVRAASGFRDLTTDPTWRYH